MTQMQQIKLQEPLPVRCRAGSAFAMYGGVQTKRGVCLPDAVRRLVVDKERKNRRQKGVEDELNGGQAS